jgi:hypothetical protein
MANADDHPQTYSHNVPISGERSNESSVVRDDKDEDDVPVKRKIACMACRNIKVSLARSS